MRPRSRVSRRGYRDASATPHGAVRASLAKAEHDGVHFKINPLAAWAPADIDAYMVRHDLPPHPLVAQGFPSIGCWPCTVPNAHDGWMGMRFVDAVIRSAQAGRAWTAA